MSFYHELPEGKKTLYKLRDFINKGGTFDQIKAKLNTDLGLEPIIEATALQELDQILKTMSVLTGHDVSREQLEIWRDKYAKTLS